jgi:hypothetical protein
MVGGRAQVPPLSLAPRSAELRFGELELGCWTLGAFYSWWPYASTLGEGGRSAAVSRAAGSAAATSLAPDHSNSPPPPFARWPVTSDGRTQVPPFSERGLSQSAAPLPARDQASDSLSSFVPRARKSSIRYRKFMGGLIWFNFFEIIGLFSYFRPQLFVWFVVNNFFKK